MNQPVIERNGKPGVWFGMKMCLLILVLIPLVVNAQYLPDLKTPKLKPGQYESLQTRSVAQTTTDFQLKGPVKSICEKITRFDSLSQQPVFLQKEYLFSEGKNLLHYLKDTTSTWYDSTDGIKEMIQTYDVAGRLLESVVYSMWPMNPSKTIKKWNSRGFIEQEIYSCNRCVSGYDNSDQGDLFDYTLDYHWSTDYDSVSLNYHYLKPKSAAPYQRESDRTYSFVHELKKKNKPAYETKFAEVVQENYFEFVTNEIKTDDHGRITEWIVWDHTIKSSVNIHVKTAYTYNDKDELTAIKHFSTGRSYSYNEFLPDFTIEIRYVSYDAFGNWTEREVRINQEHRAYFPRETYYYKRELVYY